MVALLVQMEQQLEQTQVLMLEQQEQQLELQQLEIQQLEITVQMFQTKTIHKQQ